MHIILRYNFTQQYNYLLKNGILNIQLYLNVSKDNGLAIESLTKLSKS